MKTKKPMPPPHPKPPAAKPASAKPATPKRRSALDAAALVLAKATGPMRSAELVQRILDQGLWKTRGRTPAATLNAALIREIRGKESRFRKAGRGLFAAAR